MKSKIIYTITWVIVISVILGFVAKALPTNGMEPENPIRTETTELKTDITTKSGMDPDSQEPENAQAEEQSKDSEQEEKQRQDTEEQQLEPEETIPEENREISEEQPPEGKEDKEDSVQEGNGESGDNRDDNPGKDENGKIPTEGGEEITESPGIGETPGKDEPGLVTNLYDRIITFSELEDDTINFYAYYSDASIDSNIRVNYKHKNDTGNGVWLEKKGEHDYSTQLSLGQNYITIYYTDVNGARNWARITLTYQADKADELHPVRGQHPPIIKTNLDDWQEDIKIFEFTFVVDARTYEGKRIYSNHIQVWLDGELVTNPTGSGIYEYVLQFGRPVVGDTSTHVVSVLAWDDERNSRLVKYTVQHTVHDEGVSIGSVTVEIDATTLGLGIIDEGEIDIESGDTAATAVVRMLEEYGYQYTSTGALGDNFYLATISRADAFRGAKIEERLRKLIERDGITFLPDSGRDKLGEYDFTRGSGWMYFINGELCPGKSMSKYTLNGGETISLRFTLAFGKDVGSPYSDGSTSLSSYCAKWVNGSIIELDHNYQEKERVEATKDADGYILYVCEKCKEEKREVLVYEGGDESEEPEPEEPEPEEPEPEEPEPEEPEPEEPEPGEPEPEEPEPGEPEPGEPEPEEPEPENSELEEPETS